MSASWHSCGTLAREEPRREQCTQATACNAACCAYYTRAGRLTDAASLRRADLFSEKAPAVVVLDAFLVAGVTTRVVGAAFPAGAGDSITGRVEALSQPAYTKDTSPEENKFLILGADQQSRQRGPPKVPRTRCIAFGTGCRDAPRTLSARLSTPRIQQSASPKRWAGPSGDGDPWPSGDGGGDSRHGKQQLGGNASMSSPRSQSHRHAGSMSQVPSLSISSQLSPWLGGVGATETPADASNVSAATPSASASRSRAMV